MRFPLAARQMPAVEAWLQAQSGSLGDIARHWFFCMQSCGDEVRVLLHDGQPTACVEDAAFAYVAIYTAHINVGFFLGAELSDPAGLLQGTGKFMRHVKIRPGQRVDGEALLQLICQAYQDMRRRLHGSG